MCWVRTVSPVSKARGVAIGVPDWWVIRLRAVMAERDITQASLAEKIVRATERVDTIKTYISRFFLEKEEETETKKQIRTKEFAERLQKGIGPAEKGQLELPPFVFFAASAEQAAAMDYVSKHPESYKEVSAGRIMRMIVSGEISIEDLLAGEPMSLSFPSGNAEDGKARARRGIASGTQNIKTR